MSDYNYTLNSIVSFDTEKEFHYILSDGENDFELQLDREELKHMVDKLASDLGYRNIFKKQSMSRAVKEKFSEVEDRLEKMASQTTILQEPLDRSIHSSWLPDKLTKEDVKDIVKEELKKMINE